jgi:DUF1009 family protein
VHPGQHLIKLRPAADGVTGLAKLSPRITSQTPLGIVAGNGLLPLQIAQCLAARSHPIFIVGIKGEAGPEIEQYPHAWCEWERVGHIFKTLKQRDISNIVLAGGVIGRPELKLRKLDWVGIQTLPHLLAALIGGDNAVLTGVISIIEKRGFKVQSIADLLPELTVKSGANTATKPRAADLQRIAEGVDVTRALGRFDIGQGCVVVGQRAVAVEGAEGTDAMLHRIAELRSIGRLPNRRGGVLVKAVKLGQDERADLPAIGPDTVLAVEQAGLLGIGVEAGKTLIIEREKTLQLAREHRIFIYGFDSPPQVGNG